LQLLDDPEEKAEVDDLLVWWNRYAFTVFVDLTLTLSCTVKFSPTTHPLRNRLQRIVPSLRSRRGEPHSRQHRPELGELVAMPMSIVVDIRVYQSPRSIQL
jgi:hypothetical protein